VSSDVYFYTLGARMDGSTKMQDTAASYGFDGTTGIDLPNEATGYVLTPAEKKALHAKNPTAWPYGDWFTGDSVQLAIGQNAVAVTPIQLVGAYGALANGGTVYQPHVVGRVLKPSSRVGIAIGNPDTSDVLRVIDKVVHSTVNLPPSTRDPIVAGLTGVTRSGTAAAAFSGFNQSNFAVVGKTGTAQVAGKADTSIFASFAPADAPQYAVAAVLEESGFGADAAAPLVRHVYEYLSNSDQSAVKPVDSGKQD